MEIYFLPRDFFLKAAGQMRKGEKGVGGGGGGEGVNGGGEVEGEGEGEEAGE